MKTTALLLPLLAFILFGFTGTAPQEPPAAYSIDKSHSQVAFKVRHLGISTVTGRFHDYDASLSVDPKDLSTFNTSAVIQAASIDTDNQKRDDHLRSADFFDAGAHPQITFTSKGVQNVQGNTFQVVGDLTMRGITQPVVLDVELVGTVRDPQGKDRLAFTAEGKINRKDFGLTWNRALETGGLVVGEEVTIVLDVAAVQQGS